MLVDFSKGRQCSDCLLLLHESITSPLLYLDTDRIISGYTGALLEIITRTWPTDRKYSVCILIFKEQDVKECSNCRTITLISHTSEVMLKVMQQRLLPYREPEMLVDSQAGFREGRDTRDLIVNTYWTLECSKEFQKKVSLHFVDYCKAFAWIMKSSGLL